MDEAGIRRTRKAKLEDEVDALFKLPLAEFTGSRNNLAAQLKRDGRADDANLVKALAKPSVSAWAVNQLYWKHGEAFKELLAAGQRFREAQTSNSDARIADMRESLDARREALSLLSDLATVLLREAGHNPIPDTIHRITTTLEAISAYATPSDGQAPGRLSHDVDPPGFESLGSLASLASLITSVGTPKRDDHLAKVTPSQKSASTSRKAEQKAPRANEVQKIRQAEATRQRTSIPIDTQKIRQDEEARRGRIAAAKISLQDAKRSLSAAQSSAQRLEAAKKKAHAEAKEADALFRQAEKQLREAEKRFEKATAASRDMTDRAQRIAADAEEAARAVEDARRNLEKASKELEVLLHESAPK
jgi:hypothetical protein